MSPTHGFKIACCSQQIPKYPVRHWSLPVGLPPHPLRFRGQHTSLGNTSMKRFPDKERITAPLNNFFPFPRVVCTHGSAELLPRLGTLPGQLAFCWLAAHLHG